MSSFICAGCVHMAFLGLEGPLSSVCSLIRGRFFKSWAASGSSIALERLHRLQKYIDWPYTKQSTNVTPSVLSCLFSRWIILSLSNVKLISGALVKEKGRSKKNLIMVKENYHMWKGGVWLSIWCCTMLMIQSVSKSHK